MARYEETVPGSIDELRKYINRNKSGLGTTISTEEETAGEVDGIKYYVAGLERYALLGENRVSLNDSIADYKENDEQLLDDIDQDVVEEPEPEKIRISRK